LIVDCCGRVINQGEMMVVVVNEVSVSFKTKKKNNNNNNNNNNKQEVRSESADYGEKR
jgi:hypothetical protein